LPATSASRAPSAAPGFERDAIRLDVGVRFQPEYLDVERAHAGIREPARSLAHERRITNHRVLHFVRRCRKQSQADVVIACVGCAGHEVRRRQFEDGQCGEGDRARHRYASAGVFT
jgi:hypothetical protein